MTLAASRMTSAKDGSTITEGSTVATPSGDTGNQRICTVCQGTASGVYFGSLVCLPCKVSQVKIKVLHPGDMLELPQM